ncbi:MAG TPA: lamin tail domain-containing protein [Sedimentisphaerales bacterium]|nr:lamin tail domain-containing protein [Sedimentisphaerales bacterium]HRS11137.1 lamin tail domain-containing protein [Sedimentisphaerales bacterium]HRV47654.1 lamin tail domain-containing protein [Sedimentisphaerales bacterium]
MRKVVATCVFCGWLTAVMAGPGGAGDLTQEPHAVGIPLFINEVMASNVSNVRDLQLDFDDWIEIYNGGEVPVDVGGMYLTDDPDDPAKWRFPTNEPGVTTIEPGAYLIVWADEEVTDGGAHPMFKLHAGFKLDASGDEVCLFGADGTTLIDRLTFGEQTADVSFGRYPDGGETLRFFGLPTPGQPNNEGYLGELAPLRFSHERGFYDGPFDLVITCATEGAEIIYTTNGRVPNDESGRFPPGRPYTAPLRIGTTTCLRAMAIKPGWKPTRVYTHTYILGASESIRSLPVISLVGDPGKTFYEPDGVMAIVGGSYVDGVWTPSGPGSYNNPTNRDLERPVSCEWLIPQDDGAFQIDCGLRVHGSPYMRPRYVRQSGRWSGNGKFSLRLYFRGQYGASWLEQPLFAESNAERFKSIVLRAGHNDQSNPFIKDELLRRLHKDMGNAAALGTMANLFINGEYKGYFNPTEHIKEEACQEWFDSDQPWDVMTMNGIRDGDTRSWDAMMEFARTHNLDDPANYEQMGRLLDIPSFVDYLIIRLWPNDWDWPQNNWAAAAERSPTGQWKFFVWDAEGTFEPSQLTLNRFSELNSQSNANGILYRALKASRQFRQLFGDRLYRHFYNGGALASQNVHARFNALRDELQGVIGSMNNYIVSTWLPDRRDIFMTACMNEGLYTFDGPLFAVNTSYRQGGYASAGDRLYLIPPYNGVDIYYSLDGTDPGEPQATIQPTVTKLVPQNAAKYVLVPTGPDVGNWTNPRAYEDSRWTISRGSPGGVGYERSSGYESYIGVDVGEQMYGVNGSCYIRIPFEFTGDRNALHTMTLKMQYDDGFVAYLNGTEVARRNFSGVPAWNSVAGASHDDAAAVVFEAVDISSHIPTLRSGYNLLAIHGLNVSPTSSDFLIGVELEVADKETAKEPEDALRYTGPIPLTTSTHVKARALLGGVWSALNEATFAVGPVAESLRISEIMYHPLDPNAEYVELTNVGSVPINLNRVRFTDGIDFTFSDVELTPGGHVLVVKELAAFEANHGAGLPIAGQYAGSLSNAGERIELCDAAGTVIQAVRYRDDWYGITDGAGFSLTARSLGGTDAWNHHDAWRPSATAGGSPGFDDAGQIPAPGAIVINELLANSSGGVPDWIELHNTTDEPVDVGGWFVSDSADDLTRYEIAPGTTIAPQGYLVLTEDQHFGNEKDPGCREPFAFSRSGETAYLHSGCDGVLTGYSDAVTFGPSESGVTFGRHRTSTGASHFMAMSRPTPGQRNPYPQVGPVVITEIMYNPGLSQHAEYVELLNASDSEVVFYDFERAVPWRFSDDPDHPSVEFFFPDDPPVTLPPRRYLVLAKDRAVLERLYSVGASAQVFEWGAGSLSNSTGTVQLSAPGDLADDGRREWICLERVRYSDGSRHDDFPAGHDPWPIGADGSGLSLSRMRADRYSDDPNNWQSAMPSVGGARGRYAP